MNQNLIRFNDVAVFFLLFFFFCMSVFFWWFVELNGWLYKFIIDQIKTCYQKIKRISERRIEWLNGQTNEWVNEEMDT